MRTYSPRKWISLTCILVLLIEGNEGFFMRHSSTGLCPKATDQPGFSGSWGAWWPLLFNSNCTHPHAQFRFDGDYLKSPTLRGTVTGYGQSDLLTGVYNPTGDDWDKNENFKVRQKMSGSLTQKRGTECFSAIKCNNGKSCNFNTAKSPAEGDRFNLGTPCDKELQRFTFGSVTGKGSKMKDVGCPATQRMNVSTARFGFNTVSTPDDDNCTFQAICVAKTQCDGKVSCEITVDDQLFQASHCSKPLKELYVEYNCVDSLSKPIIKASKIRLSELPNEGFVEVFDGSKWRKVDDKNWDERMQSMLCRYLGYEARKSNAKIKMKISSGKAMASGTLNLHCIGSLDISQSCCTQLFSETSTRGLMIPHTECKICDEPLLQNATGFPNDMFSGSDSNSYKARYSDVGYCPTNSGLQYLEIDLKREFFISHIAMFADKNQTKGMKSYSLKYSRTKGGLRSAKEIKINEDAFRASIRKLDALYVRYLKIDMKNSCIRVQLCGHALVPDAVSNAKLVSKTARTARISWSTPQEQGHSEVTYFLMRGNGISNNITARSGSQQYEFKNLKPYTNYTVTIEAGNAYGVGEEVPLRFTTKEAAPKSPPSQLTVTILSSSSARLTWQPPPKDKRNGLITHYTIYQKQGAQSYGNPKETFYVVTNLNNASEYSFQVTAHTKAGEGPPTNFISKITNQVPVALVSKTYHSLLIDIPKPPNKFKTILVVVQNSKTATKISNLYETAELYSGGSSAPYVTAVLRTNALKNPVVIGTGNWYNTTNPPTFIHDKPFKEKSEYIVFVRFIESKELYFSSDWSSSISTYSKPGAPSDVKAVALSSSSLNVSWEKSGLEAGVTLEAYRVCYEDNVNDNTCPSTNSLSYSIDGLQPWKKYEIRVRAETTAGESEYARTSKFTYGKPVEMIRKTFSKFYISYSPPPQSFLYLHIIVYATSVLTKKPDDYPPNTLQTYKKHTSGPYIAAYLGFKENGSNTFTVGDSRWYNHSTNSFYNVPLEQNKSYHVFARFFENETEYRSTGWSTTVTIPQRPLAPEIDKIVSHGEKALRISWKQPPLPNGQTATNYIIYYSSGNKQNSTETAQLSYTLKDVQYETKYSFQLAIVTKYGRSQQSSIANITTNSEPLSPQKEKDNSSFIVKLRKPRDDGIENVKLVILQLQSESTEPTPPEKVELKDKASINKNDDNVAFVAKNVRINEFEEDTINVVLRVSGSERRRRRVSEANLALDPKPRYRTAQMNFDSSGRRFSSYWSKVFQFPNEGENNDKQGGRGGDGAAGIAIGVTVAILLVVIAVGGVFFWRRRANRNYSEKQTVYHSGLDHVQGIDKDDNEGREIEDGLSNEGIYSNETGFSFKQAHPPVPVSEFAHYVNEMKANDNSAFQKEYEELPTTMNASWEISRKSINKRKNRYGNIVTYDHSRVVLSGDEDEDYINASFIDGLKENSYIACQGPTKITLNDMWQMIWEQRVYSIVMVTSLVELGKHKCEKYWPGSDSQMYGDIEVMIVKTEEFASHVTHTLQMKKDGESREVKHYYFSSWPDHGVPKYPTQLLAFRRHFRTYHLQQSGPIVVHCSAGVGRTGVFLAIDKILEKLEKGVTNTIDVFGEIVAMRERRMNMIQTLEQYIFVHEAVLETILCGMNEVDSSRIKNEIKNLSAVQAGGITGFQEKFKRLGEVSPKYSDEECEAGLLEENQTKNRIKSIYPAESNRVCIRHVENEAYSDYINAVFVHGYLGKNYFIATQTPLPHTINDFWRMVHEKKSSAVVLLNNVKDGTSFPKFWPSNRAQPKQYGDLTVQLESATEKDGIVTRKFILSPYPDLKNGYAVKIFQYTRWPDHRTPETADGVITLTSLVEKSRQNSEMKGPIVVTCSNGAGRSGTYIAISNLLERMKIEQAVDVFQAIKIIRASRPQFVENAAQFEFCYAAVSAYLDAFSEYANFE